MKYLLLVTWFSGAGVSSYQVTFNDVAACGEARQSILAEIPKMEEAQLAANQGWAFQPMMPPKASAVCVALGVIR